MHTNIFCNPFFSILNSGAAFLPRLIILYQLYTVKYGLNAAIIAEITTATVVAITTGVASATATVVAITTGTASATATVAETTTGTASASAVVESELRGKIGIYAAAACAI
ncbi:MAG: hypothetical protein ACI4MH_07045 [Candidatus Coproplasma sp.]